jgi:hypothetical protein
MDALAQGVNTFIEGSSDLLEGISSDEKRMETGGLAVDSEIYMKILHRVLSENPTNLRFDDLAPPGVQKHALESYDLLKFFSKKDFDWDDDEGMNDIDEDMKGIVVSVDL